MKHFIIGTAGHVDHGKTSLIRALTGIDTDRLREERERGLSIVPGYAHMQLPPTEYSTSGRTVGIVDVPGHERFLKNMLTGASGVDIAILVIAADEGVMPQTREHLRVLELLNVRRSIVALTKTDLVEDQWRAMIGDDVRAQLLSTRFAAAPLIEVSAVRGDGLDELKQVLACLCDDLEDQKTKVKDQAAFRLPIDRAFTVAGFGTVVTGSLHDGAVSVGEAVDVWRLGASTPIMSRVRGLEVHDHSTERAQPGQRVAVNLANVPLDQDLRGGLLAAPGTLRAREVIEVSLQISPETPRPLKDDATLRLHRGAAEVGARVLLYDGAHLDAGETGFARLRLDAPLPLARGDRFILRDVSSERILGGGVLLEASRLPRDAARQWLPKLKAALEADDDNKLIALLLQRAGLRGLSDSELQLELYRLDLSKTLDALQQGKLLWRSGDLYLQGQAADGLKQQIQSTLKNFHQREPLQYAMPREALRALLPKELTAPHYEALLHELEREQKIVLETGGVRLFSHRMALSDEEQRIMARIGEICDGAAWQPPTIEELAKQFPKPAAAQKLIYAAIKIGSLIRTGDFVFSAKRIAEAEAKIREHFSQRSTLSFAEARELFNASRKWLVPLLEYFDRAGVTRRDGDVRVLKR